MTTRLSHPHLRKTPQSNQIAPHCGLLSPRHLQLKPPAQRLCAGEGPGRELLSFPPISPTRAWSEEDLVVGFFFFFPFARNQMGASLSPSSGVEWQPPVFFLQVHPLPAECVWLGSERNRSLRYHRCTGPCVARGGGFFPRKKSAPFAPCWNSSDQGNGICSELSDLPQANVAAEAEPASAACQQGSRENRKVHHVPSVKLCQATAHRRGPRRF